MSEVKNIERKLDKYEDIERLSLILDLYKKGHVDRDQAVVLIQGDKKYQDQPAYSPYWHMSGLSGITCTNAIGTSSIVPLSNL